MLVVGGNIEPMRDVAKDAVARGAAEVVADCLDHVEGAVLANRDGRAETCD